MKYTATSQKPKDKEWVDESGTSIPYKRITKSERLMERHSAMLLKSALYLNDELTAFKDLISELSQEVYDAFMAEKSSTRKSKGNFMWYNFDRSIKIEVSVNEPIQFDSLTITAAKEKFDLFLDANIQSKNSFAKTMVKEAFEAQRSGNLDTKRVMNLTRYVTQVNDPLFTEAVELINQAIRRPKTKTYFRVWQRDKNGEYQNIDLNLSSI